jgi:hypothetical protein
MLYPTLTLRAGYFFQSCGKLEKGVQGNPRRGRKGCPLELTPPPLEGRTSVRPYKTILATALVFFELNSTRPDKML